LIFVYIDPSRPEEEIGEIIEKFIPGTVYHEMSHVARFSTVDYGMNLPEVIISEGLADICVTKIKERLSS
jgi:uncharacterized protein YjaZ